MHYSGFSEEEYYCLLQAFSVDRLVGLGIPGSIKPTQENYNRGIFSLFGRGIISRIDAGFRIREDIKELFTALKEAKKIFLLSENDGDLPEYCIYLGKNEKMAVSLRGAGKDEYIRFTLVDREKSYEFIKETGYTSPVYNINISQLNTENGETIKVHTIKSLKEEL